MYNDQFIIRQSKKKQVGYLLLTGLMILWYFVGPYEKTRIIYVKNPTLTIIFGIIFFGLFSYFLNELIKRRPEITLTVEGIELRDKGFFNWTMIESFKTVYYKYSDTYSEDLILNLKDTTQVKFDISHLEKKRDEITNLILSYKGTASLYYLGQERK